MTDARLGALLLLLLPVQAHAWSGGAIDAQTMKRFGGTYRPDCTNASSPQATILRDALVIVKGDKRVSAKLVSEEDYVAWFGQVPPDHFQESFEARLPDGEDIAFLVYEDAKGPYLSIGWGPKLKAAFGQATLDLVYRLCDAPSREVTPKPPAAEEKPAPGELPDSDAMIRNSAFRAAYLKALGKYSKETWLAEMKGRAGATSKVTVAGEEFLQVNFCKLHDCGASNTTVLYSAARKKAYGKVSIAGKTALIGKPSPEIAKALGELWRRQWVHDR